MDILALGFSLFPQYYETCTSFSSSENYRSSYRSGPARYTPSSNSLLLSSRPNKRKRDDNDEYPRKKQRIHERSS